MLMQDIPVPEIYKSSEDFRIFLKWFELALTKIKDNTDNFLDILDPLRCPENLLWCLADTIGFKYDDRLPTSYNRLVMLYFMSMIRLKGSKDGVTLAAEINLAQFPILEKALTGYYQSNPETGQTEFVPPKDILNDRLDDTTIPVNSAFVTPHTDEGYIELVYFSSRKPVDACIEYVRPLGMYMFEFAGVRYDARTKISIDARLTDERDSRVSIGATHVGHYSREDYARLQKVKDRSESEAGLVADPEHRRFDSYLRNSEYELVPSQRSGYRALYSLQLANNDHIVQSLIRNPEDPVGPDKVPDKIFSIGYYPVSEEPDVIVPRPLTDDYRRHIDYLHVKPANAKRERGPWNLRYDAMTDRQLSQDTYVLDPARPAADDYNPVPRVNPVMMTLGDAIRLNATNSEYSKVDADGNITAGPPQDS